MLIIWSGSVSILFFYILKKVNKLRVGFIYEITGMDMLIEGGNDIISAELINKIEEKQREVNVSTLV